MDSKDLLLAADGALRGVIDRLTPDDLHRPVPEAWVRGVDEPVLRDALTVHAYDEAWIPDLIAGRSASDDDPWLHADLLGEDPVAAYDALHDRATAAIATAGPDLVLRFSYGDHSAAEGFPHLAAYRAFQAWSIAKLAGLPFRLGPELVGGLREHVVPHVDEWRTWGVFPPAVTPPDGADEETLLLCTAGFWTP